MAKHGKKYMAAMAKIDREKLYSPKEAVSLAKETSFSKFDATVSPNGKRSSGIRSKCLIFFFSFSILNLFS